MLPNNFDVDMHFLRLSFLSFFFCSSSDSDGADDEDETQRQGATQKVSIKSNNPLGDAQKEVRGLRCSPLLCASLGVPQREAFGDH